MTLHLYVILCLMVSLSLSLESVCPHMTPDCLHAQVVAKAHKHKRIIKRAQGHVRKPFQRHAKSEFRRT